MIAVYNILSIAGLVLSLPVLIPVCIFSHKRRATVLHRLGLKPLPCKVREKSADRPIWVHALSVGEVLSAEPLVQKISHHFKGRPLFFSASTKTGFDMAEKKYGKIADAVFFFPYDIYFSVKKIVNQVKPDLVVLVESDIWPNFLFDMKYRNTPVILTNARLSERSYNGYRRFAGFSKAVFSCFSKICAQTRDDATRYCGLGLEKERIAVTGNIKFDQPGTEFNDEELNALKKRLMIEPNQKILVAGSVHRCELQELYNAYTQIEQEVDNLLLIIAPRNPDHAGVFCEKFRSGGFKVSAMKELENISGPRKVVVIDTMGILRKLYSLADVTFIGGSLCKRGGHNPLEPAAFAKPVLFGADMSDFSEPVKLLLESVGGKQVKDSSELYESSVMLLNDSDKAREMGRQAFRVFNTNKGAVNNTMQEIINTYEQFQGKS
ncbi:MAG: 3-deoxy-D-manno-octulosonic acid transferase [Desulfobacterales bacterium]|nr:3-deoxy-D-manno-octulosonic acid transferase [Desulfobacterales bacterium]